MAASRGSPRILAMLCSWHPLTAADNAGMDGLSYGTSTTVVPVDCAGEVSVAAILRAFAEQADGVLVAACGSGDCHYVNGNESCERIVAEARELMCVAGLEPERLRIDLSSDVSGARFVEMVEDFTAEVAKLDGRKGGSRKPARKAAKKASRKPTKKAAKKAGKKTGGKTTAARKTAKKAAKPTKKAGKKTAAKKGGKTSTRTGRAR